MALTYKEIKVIEKQLSGLLPSLTNDDDVYMLEYGDVGSQIHTTLRIWYMSIADGMQYTLKQVLLGRGEASLGYFQNPEGCLEAAIDYILHYHRDTPFKDKLKELRAKNKLSAKPDVVLSWYALSYEEITGRARSSRPNVVDEETLDQMFGKAKIVTLG
jgi:hypothetical protein